jgi:uncharacterized protein YdiU (UPF0061 family)
MYGKLQPGLSEDELNKLIKEVLKKMNKTELDLKEAYRALERAIRWEESTLEEYLQDMRDIMTIIGGIPIIGDAVSAGNVVREKFNNSDYATEEAISDLGIVYVKSKVPGLSQAEVIIAAEDLHWRKQLKERDLKAT